MSPGDDDQPLTGVDVVDAVYVVVVNFVAPLTLMVFFYSRIFVGAGPDEETRVRNDRRYDAT